MQIKMRNIFDNVSLMFLVETLVYTSVHYSKLSTPQEKIDSNWKKLKLTYFSQSVIF